MIPSNNPSEQPTEMPTTVADVAVSVTVEGNISIVVVDENNIAKVRFVC